jgi:ABC-type nickel/cobalt efflux system permease component RcnA
MLLAQRQLVGELQHHMASIRDGGSWAGAAAVVGVAALYGVLHAAGPGHGKIVIASYFSSRRARLAQALKMSAGQSLVQALSAILLVGVLSLALDLGTRRMMAGAGWAEVASFALIGLFGLTIAVRAARGWTGGGHGHGCCGPNHHHHDHGHAPHSVREMVMGALAVGLRPCTGALLVLLFTFANGLYALGIIAVLAMAAGSAVTVALVGVGSIGARSALARLAGGRDHPGLRRAVAILGGLAIALAGFGMMAAAWSGALAGLGPTG